MTESDNDFFRLSLSGEGINIDKRVDRETALAIVAAVLGRSAEPAESRKKSSSLQSMAAPAVSLRKYLDEVAAPNKHDQIAAIGHYILTHEGKASFSRDDIKTHYAVAREPMPANFPRDFNNAIKGGLIQEVHGERGRFYVTVKGENAIEYKFKKNGNI